MHCIARHKNLSWGGGGVRSLCFSTWSTYFTGNFPIKVMFDEHRTNVTNDRLRSVTVTTNETSRYSDRLVLLPIAFLESFPSQRS